MSGNIMRIEALNKVNYDTWKLQVEAVLIKNDLWGYVNGSLAKPAVVAGNAESSKAAENWEIGDSKARSDLILCICPSELKQIKSCKTSQEIWQKLESVYQSKGPARKANLLKKLTLSKMKSGENVREHLDQFFDVVDKLEEMDVSINLELLSVMILYSLPDDFENFRCAIESRDEFPTPDVLRIKIVEESDARKNKDESVQDVLFAKNNNYYKKTKNNIYKSGGKDKKGAENFSREYFKFKCHKCHKIGHKAADCRSKNKGNDHQNARQAEEVYIVEEIPAKHETVLMMNHGGNKEWCLDSGCTSHMSAGKYNFKELIPCSKPLNLANNLSTEIKGIGEISIPVSKEKSLLLKNSLHVPDLRVNLMSVSKITDKGHEVHFKQNEAVIFSQSKEIVAKAKRIGDLYYLETIPSETANVVHLNKKSMIEQWHLKFGHLNEASLREICRKKLVFGVEIEKNEKLPPCEVCVKGKQTQNPFPIGDMKRTTRLLEIVHSDVCGPMRTQSIGGAKYFVTFIDDKSRWSEIYFLKKKSDVFEAFQNFKSHAENHTGEKIKFLQTDNGSEYCSRQFDDYLAKNGIRRRLSVAHTPQQNGVSERKNRTLVEMARCQLIQSKLSPSFWAEAVSTANYIRNRCPSKSLNEQTPYFLWNKKHPTATHFKIFGCKAFALNKNPTRGKFDDKSTECIFIGYSNEAKAFRLFDPKTKKVIVSRDVKFFDMFNENESYEDFMENNIDQRIISIQQNTTGEHENLHEMTKNESENEEKCNENLEEESDNDVQIPNDEENQKGDDRKENSHRGRGRPRIIQTGKRGRPRKEYSVNPDFRHGNVYHQESGNSNENEFAGMAQLINAVSINEALSSPESIEWKKAIKDEYIAQIRNNTWDIVENPNDSQIIRNKLILQTKYKADGKVAKRKARLVAKGYTQQYGTDFSETFAPVMRASSIRLIMALSAELGLKVHQMDVVTAYLNGEIEEELFMEIPEQLNAILEEIISESKEEHPEVVKTSMKWLQQMKKGNKVCLIRKALYGLRQSGRQWYRRLDAELRKLLLKPLDADPCVYWSKINENLILIGIYVDDIIIATNNDQKMNDLKSNLSSIFEMKDLGAVNYCLGIQFTQNLRDGKITLCQKTFIKKILEKFGMENCKPIRTPLDANEKLISPRSLNKEEMEKYPYQSLIGSLMYLSVSTRPDIAYTVSMLSQFNQNYSMEHWKAAKRVLRYLKGTADSSLVFQRTGENLVGFADADWGSCIQDRRSYTGYIFKLAGGAVSWEARKQRTVALSSTEAEYMALTEAAKEAIYLGRFLQEIGIHEEKITIYSDNQGAKRLVENPVFHSRTKHIDIRHHFVRDVYKQKLIDIKYIPTADMVADILTKSLHGPKHDYFMECMGVI